MGFSSARNLGRDISAGFSPPRRMPISEAVKKFMRVPKGAGNSVPWDPELTPYIIEPMNCLASREYDAVIFVGPARTGKTIGLIDGWIVYKAMACIQSKRTEEFKKMPESIRNMITPPRNSAPRVQDDEPAASRTPVQAAAPVVDENSIRAQVLAEQKARVNGINDLFAMFGGR